MDDIKTFSPPEAKLHFLDYWRVIRIRKAIIITVFLITAIIATAVTFVLPESYSSTARIKVENDVTDIPGMNGTPTVTSFDPYFIQTTFEIMQSHLVLSNVVAALNLNVEWGKKYFNGETLKTTEAMEILKQRMQLAPVKNTKLIAITVFSDDKDEAAKLANQIAIAYEAYRYASRRELTTNGVAVLEDQFRSQQHDIATNQDYIEHLRNELHITDTDPHATSPSPTIDSVQLQAINSQRIEGEKVYNEQLVQLQELKSIQSNSPAKLRDVLPQMVQDSELSSLLSKLHEAQENFVTKTNDYSLFNIEVQRIQSLMTQLNHEIDDRVVGIMAGLESKVVSTKSSLDALTAKVDEAKLKVRKRPKKTSRTTMPSANCSRSSACIKCCMPS